jgi:hypothetical protein
MAASAARPTDRQGYDLKAFHLTLRQIFADYRLRCRELRFRYGLPAEKDRYEDQRWWVQGLTPWD